jgi:GTP cyclohydrolase IA
MSERDEGAFGVDLHRAAAAVKELLSALGEDPNRPGLEATPMRVAEMYAELLQGMAESPDGQLSVTFSSDHDEMVMVKQIPFASLCEHHLIPFIGVAHLAYIPNEDGRITGLSKLARLVDAHSHRLQLQERLTSEIAESIERVLAPRGTLVVIEAEHLCMTIRGVRKPGAKTITSAVRGLFRSDAATRAEAMAFVRSGG